jgi:hypothetical protein
MGKEPRRNRYQLAAGAEKPMMPHSAGDARAIRQIYSTMAGWMRAHARFNR